MLQVKKLKSELAVLRRKQTLLEKQINAKSSEVNHLNGLLKKLKEPTGSYVYTSDKQGIRLFWFPDYKNYFYSNNASITLGWRNNKVSNYYPQARNSKKYYDLDVFIADIIALGFKDLTDAFILKLNNDKKYQQIKTIAEANKVLESSDLMIDYIDANEVNIRKLSTFELMDTVKFNGLQKKLMKVLE